MCEGEVRATVQLRIAGRQNDDGGGISGFSGISGSGSRGISASAAAAAGFRAGGARGRLSRFGVDW